jgi:excisionase family DNA binding protein
MDRKQAAEYLHVCRTTLDRLNLPRIQVRRRVLFKRATLERWLEDHTTQVKGVQSCPRNPPRDDNGEHLQYMGERKHAYKNAKAKTVDSINLKEVSNA